VLNRVESTEYSWETTVVYTQEYPITLPIIGIGQTPKSFGAWRLPIVWWVKYFTKHYRLLYCSKSSNTLHYWITSLMIKTETISHVVSVFPVLFHCQIQNKQQVCHYNNFSALNTLLSLIYM